jgi:hypothetical protein
VWGERAASVGLPFIAANDEARGREGMKAATSGGFSRTVSFRY